MYTFNPLLEGVLGNKINQATKVANNAGFIKRISSTVKNKKMRDAAAKQLKDIRKGAGSKFGQDILNKAADATKKANFDIAEKGVAGYRKYVANPTGTARVFRDKMVNG